MLCFERPRLARATDPSVLGAVQRRCRPTTGPQRRAGAAAVVATLALLGATPAATATTALECDAVDRPPSAENPQVAERAVACLVDAERRALGLDRLEHDDRLSRAADWHARDMRERQFFGHTAPTGSPRGRHPWDRVTAAGYRWAAVAENIARGQPTPRAVAAAWFRSEGHCRNLLSPDARETGVAVRGGEDGPWWVQLVARPRAAGPSRDLRARCDGGHRVAWAPPSTDAVARGSSQGGAFTIEVRRRDDDVVVTGTAPEEVAAVVVILRRGVRRTSRRTDVRDGRYAATLRPPAGDGRIYVQARPA